MIASFNFAPTFGYPFSDKIYKLYVPKYIDHLLLLNILNCFAHCYVDLNISALLHLIERYLSTAQNNFSTLGK